MSKSNYLAYRPLFRIAAAWIFCTTAGQAQDASPDFTGIWSGSTTTKNSEIWQLEDFLVCVAGCTPASRRYIGFLIDDPTMDNQSIQTLVGMTVGYMRRELAEKSTPEGLALLEANTVANDPTLECRPYGLVREATSVLPMAIRQEGENLAIDYEEWNQSRAIYMDGRGHPAGLTPTPLGHSVGRYENEELLIDSVAIEADIYYSLFSGGAHSDQAAVVERYTIYDDPRRLTLKLTVTDPVTLTEPYVIEKSWLFTPDVEMVEDSCGDVPGIP